MERNNINNFNYISVENLDILYNDITNYAHQLVNKTEHVWTNSYDITYVLPWKLSHIFYSEYGAWADREYMGLTDNWSKIIEGSHCTQCALFSLMAILFKLNKNNKNYIIALSVAMGTQFMNSFLYMYAYFIQEREPDSINYNSTIFPTDTWLIKRPFMWVNIFWLVMPFYTIFYYLLTNIGLDEQVSLKKHFSESDFIPFSSFENKFN